MSSSSSSPLPILTSSPLPYPTLLKSSSLPLGRQLHAHLLKSNSADLYSHTALLNLYAHSNSLSDALKVFDRMPQRSIPTWNSLISGLAHNNLVHEALETIYSMQRSNLDVGTSTWNSLIAGCVSSNHITLAFEILSLMSSKPNSNTFNTLLPVIPDVKDSILLREFHAFAIRNVEAMDRASEDRTWSAIATAYANLGVMESAMRLFERVRLKNSQLGSSMISGLLNCGMTDEAFLIFREMAEDCIREAKILSRVSLTLLLPHCDRELTTGLEIHAYAFRTGLDTDTSVGNALLAMYSRRGDCDSVNEVFTRILDKDVVSWNTIMAHDSDRSFEVFKQMRDDGIEPDEFSFSSLLHACGHFSCIRQGMALHAHVLKSGFLNPYLVIENSLMDAYGKCGCVDDARKIFDEMHQRDNISWNTMISCYGFSAFPHEAITMFDRMVACGLKPNRSTFVALLSACSHSGNLEKALHYFQNMTRHHKIVPDTDHYTCIVDNMGRDGQLERAYQFIKDMPIKPDDCVWSALLSSCRIHGNINLAEIAARNLIELESGHSGYWVLLSNIYADASRWRDVSSVRSVMRDVGIKKNPGYSWIEVGGSEIHRFLTADKLHEHRDDIYFAIDGLTALLKDEGYVPVTDP